MNKSLQNKKVLILSLIFAGFLLFWLSINLFKVFSNPGSARSLFTNTYGIVALIGGISAIRTARYWGGYKSLIGRAIVLFGLGLLAQEFGQLMYAYYIYVQHITVPYPSLGDVGYFGSVLLYIAAVCVLLRATGTKYSIVTTAGKAKAFIVPLALLIFSYTVFLRNYDFAKTPHLTALLDFGYPLLQSLYISLAIVVFLLSRKYIGGLMKPVILLLIFSLAVQYSADFSFLYQVKHNNWSPGGSNDLVYLIAYFIMSVSLLRFETIAKNLRRSNDG